MIVNPIDPTPEEVEQMRVARLFSSLEQERIREDVEKFIQQARRHSRFPAAAFPRSEGEA